MKLLVLDGWQPGLNKVALTKLLHDRTELSLAAAKRQVDQLLDGQSAGVLIPDSEDAEDLGIAVRRLWASAYLITASTDQARSSDPH